VCDITELKVVQEDGWIAPGTGAIFTLGSPFDLGWLSASISYPQPMAMLLRKYVEAKGVGGGAP
jgi:hypothetical protein